MVKLRSKIFRFNKAQASIEEKCQFTKSNEKLAPDLTVRTISKTQYNQNDITNPSIMKNSRILNSNNMGLDKVENLDLNNSYNKKSMLIENYAQVLIKNLKLTNYTKNNSKLNYYLPDGL